MPDEIILSCPFCHHRGEYQDAPAGSTARCHDCGSIFRVPAIGLRKPGTVVKGEQIRGGGGVKKLVVWLLVLAILGAGGYFCWQKWGNPPQLDDDPFPKSKWEAGTAPGTLERFLLSWQKEDMELLLRYCRLADQAKRNDREFTQRLQSMFGDIRLVKYDIIDFKEVNPYLHLYRVNVDGQDTRTGLGRKGTMSPRVYLEEVPKETTGEGPEKTEETPEKKWRWGVDVRSAVVRWED